MKHLSNPFSNSAALAASIIFITGSADATVYQWDGGASTDNWQTANNWNPDALNLAFNGTFAHRLNVNGSQNLTYTSNEGNTVYTGDTVTGGGRGLVIGSGTSGTMIITGGSFSTASAGEDIVGNANNSIGIITINGGDFIGSTTGGTSLGIGTGTGRVSTLNVQSGSATITALKMNSSLATINISGSGTLAVNSISKVTGSTANINFDGGTLKARVATVSFLTGLNTATINGGGVTVDSNNVNITIAQNLIGGTGNGGLAKTGDGILTLSGTNTYTGATTLTQGTLSVGASANLGAAASNIVFDGGALRITGTTLTSISGIGHTVAFNAGKLVALDIDSTSNTFTVDQVLNQTTGGFTKLGVGKVVFTQANTYSGDTTISAGAIIRQIADTTSGSISVANGATFVLRGGITDGAGQSISINGSGATGSNYFFEGSAVQRGALQAQSGANTWAGDIVINGTANTRIGVQDGASLTLTGDISESVAGSGVLFRAGALGDDIILSGTGSWTGDTTLFSNGGSIKITDNNRLSTAARAYFTTGGSTVFDLNGFNQEFAGIESISGAITMQSNVAGSSTLTSNTPVATSFNNLGVIADGSGTVSFVKQGAGTQTFSNTNTYTGNTTISNGTLSLNGNGSINSSALIDVQSSATFSIAGVTTSTTIGSASAQTLQGIGTVNLGGKTLTIGASGTLAPGTSPGTLQFDASTGGKLDFDIGATITFELGTTSDLIAFTSAGDWLTGSGNATLDLSLLAGFDYSDTYTIFENVTTAGFAFADITGYDSAGYSANFIQNGDNYDLSFTVIPEPRAALLGTFGLLALLRRRRSP
jgi:autotransporter-associated beta strand protein